VFGTLIIDARRPDFKLPAGGATACCEHAEAGLRRRLAPILMTVISEIRPA
jgi:hypothetical protein